MKAAMRLTLVGLSVITGATIAAGPAQAATTTDRTPGTTAAQQRPWDDDDEVVGYYRTRWQCEIAGRIGERRDRWDDYDCERVRWGFRRGFWALEVQRDWYSDDHDWDDHDWDHHHRGGADDNRR